MHSSFKSPGQVITGEVISLTIIICTHCPVLPHESAISYVRVIVLGQVPLSASVTENVDTSRPQLSVALPPPLTKSVNVVKAGGTSPMHSSFKSPGHVIIGRTASATSDMANSLRNLAHPAACEDSSQRRPCGNDATHLPEDRGPPQDLAPDATLARDAGCPGIQGPIPPPVLMGMFSDMPRKPRSPLVRASRVTKSACVPLVIHILLPLMT